MARSARTRTIDEFPFVPIAKDLREGRCIPFLGAGASSFPKDLQQKPPIASSLARELAEEWRHPQFEVSNQTANSGNLEKLEHSFRAKTDCENLMLVSSWVENGPGDRSHLNHKLREHLANPQRPLPFNDLHKLLAQVAKQKPMAVITTNYDDLIEQALIDEEVPFDLFVVAIDRPAVERRPQGNDRPAGERRPRGALLFRPAERDELQPVTGEHQLLDLELKGDQIHLKRTALFKIHGHIDRIRETDDTFVITEDDYVSFLGRMGPENSVIPADLVAIMQSRTLLFLGYGLRDWNFRVLLDRLNGSRLQPKRSYAISHGIEEAESELWHARRVFIVDADLNEFVPRLDNALAAAQLPSS
jgi:NAD-dependent SIR2 family protein deacetylase